MSARIIRNIEDTPNLTPLQFPEHKGLAPNSRTRRPAPKTADRIIGQSKDASGSGQGLVAQARAQAEQILSEAYAEAERIENKAYEQGYRAGQDAAAISSEERLKQVKAEYENSIIQLSRLREDMLSHCETDLIRLVMEIAKKVVHREVTVDREIVLTLIRVALKRIGSDTAATIHLHNDDFKILEDRRHEFLTGENGVVNLVADRSISRGGCLIETKLGSVDARIEEQFKEVERGFFGLV